MSFIQEWNGQRWGRNSRLGLNIFSHRLTFTSPCRCFQKGRGTGILMVSVSQTPAKIWQSGSSLCFFWMKNPLCLFFFFFKSLMDSLPCSKGTGSPPLSSLSALWRLRMDCPCPLGWDVLLGLDLGIGPSNKNQNELTQLDERKVTTRLNTEPRLFNTLGSSNSLLTAMWSVSQSFCYLKGFLKNCLSFRCYFNKLAVGPVSREFTILNYTDVTAVQLRLYEML